MGPGSMDECLGCIYEESDDIKVHLEYCSHCKRAYYNEDERDIHEDLYSPMFMTRRTGRSDSNIDCNQCGWLNIREELQNKLYEEQKRSINHICQYYDKRVIHRGSSKDNHYRLYPCINCEKDGYRNFIE